MLSEKPADARHLKNAFAHTGLGEGVLKKLYDKAMDPKYTTTIKDYECVLSTRTGSQDMPQLKVETDGEVVRILCTHAVALYQGKRPNRWYDDMSHTCGIRQCLIHTEWELPWDNVSRDGCHKYHHFARCPHDPRCKPEPPQQLVRAALATKREAVSSAAANDPRKRKKKEENARAYERRKRARLCAQEASVRRDQGSSKQL